MSIDGYYLSKLSAAVGCLVGLGDIRMRVEYAFASMTTIKSEEFSNEEIGDRYQELYDRCTSHAAENDGEGTIRATLRHMSDEDVSDIAHKIFELHNWLLYERAPQALM
ncbi:hypothetical protein [Rhizobium rhizogenes]|uniref:Uncharacterized protein n=1 Tax=Rhizobium rhizogenes NBRC 13257 TaxID=1220581 RepID=A0AA87UCC7_RHIRH|nr:hypothetical protein [Rhizobium rhizogenes]NTG68245.1 hypothetical protein [Rhizobium rhizogenes]NTI69064.1 hypothetical protein [Rhizobium rhizogenes]TRB12888.1 hypothetical protein EXN67_09470 [Rhizobium rhizogenes]TRB37453.1 hypothetical protein EXN73_30910 [Rhizobium rhizogenes]TRB52239.1 hypothetical protein EXN71_31350 [Rhizobium rhizogenes]